MTEKLLKAWRASRNRPALSLAFVVAIVSNYFSHFLVTVLAGQHLCRSPGQVAPVAAGAPGQ